MAFLPLLSHHYLFNCLGISGLTKGLRVGRLTINSNTMAGLGKVRISPEKGCGEILLVGTLTPVLQGLCAGHCPSISVTNKPSTTVVID